MGGGPNPRLAGVKEQLARAKVLLDEAHAVRDYDVAFPKLVAPSTRHGQRSRLCARLQSSANFPCRPESSIA
jgi:hypothetical protein